MNRPFPSPTQRGRNAHVHEALPTLILPLPVIHREPPGLLSEVWEHPQAVIAVGRHRRRARAADDPTPLTWAMVGALRRCLVGDHPQCLFAQEYPRSFFIRPKPQAAQYFFCL